MADWQNFDIGVGDALEPINTGLSSTVGGLVSVVETAVAILETLASFLTVGQSPLLAGVQILLAELQQLLINLEESGAYGLFLVPTNIPQLIAHRGGYGKFEQTFLQSFNDIEDPERPQIGETGVLGGITLYVSEETPADLIRSVSTLYEFFDLKFELAYPPPVNLTVQVLDSSDSPFDLLGSFVTGDSDPESLLLEWQEPRYANDVLLDIFRTNKFLIERSKSREGTLVLKERTAVPNRTPLNKREEKDGKTPSVPDPLLDEDGERVFYWEPVDPSDPFVEISDLVTSPDILENTRYNFLAGTYAYKLEKVQPGIENAYYYRVRSVPSDAQLVSRPGKGYVNGKVEDVTIYEVQRNGQAIDQKSSLPSLPVFGFLPDVDVKFDLPTAILNTYRLAYLLRFDAFIFDSNNNTVLGSDSIDPGIPEALFDIESEGVVELEDSATSYFADPIFPPGTIVSDYTAAKTSIGKELVVDLADLSFYAGVDEFILPRSSLPDYEQVQLAIDRLADNKVKRLVPFVSSNEPLFELFRQLYGTAQSDIADALTSGIPLGTFLSSAGLRQQVFTLVQLLEGGARPGLPPNWESVKVLEDLFPDVKEVTSKLFDIIAAFNNVLLSSLDELRATLEGIQDRLEAITALLDVLDNLINRILSLLSLDFEIDVLWVPPAPGGNRRYLSEFVNSQNRPDSPPDEYYAAITLLIGGASTADTDAVANAFSLLFGI